MGFSVKEIKDLMDKMQQTGLGELEVEDEGYTLKLSAKKAKKTVENVVMAPTAPVVSAAPIAIGIMGMNRVTFAGNTLLCANNLIGCLITAVNKTMTTAITAPTTPPLVKKCINSSIPFSF